jgi:transposase
VVLGIAGCEHPELLTSKTYECDKAVRRQRLRDRFSGLKSGTPKKDIRRATRKQYSAEEKIRIVLDGLRGEHSIAELCRREGIAESLYYTWSKEFLEAGKRRVAGDTARAATSGEVKDLRREARALKEVVVLECVACLPFEAGRRLSSPCAGR